MIKAIIFDFDGVIIESAEIKTRAFQQIFAGYPDKIEEITLFHQQNMGISRYIKFRHIYKNILNMDLSSEKELILGENFSDIVLQEILRAPFVQGTVEFLTTNKVRYRFFIASGTPGEELNNIVAGRGIGSFFAEVHGSPLQKTEIIKGILSRYSLKQKEVVFVGDALSDQSAAEKAGLVFIARITAENISQLQSCQWKINDLTGLSDLLREIESC